MLRFIQMRNNCSLSLRHILIILTILQICIYFISPNKLVAESKQEEYLVFRTKQWTSIFERNPEILVSREESTSKKAKYFRIFMTSSICSSTIKKSTIRSLTEELEKINSATMEFMTNDIAPKNWLVNNTYEDRNIDSLKTMVRKYNVKILSIPWALAGYIRRCTITIFLKTGRTEFIPFANKANSIEAPLANFIVQLFTNKDVAPSPEDRILAWRVAEDTMGYIPSMSYRMKIEELKKVEKFCKNIFNQLSTNYNLEDNDEVRFTAEGVLIELENAEREIARQLHEK